jgi:ubiquinone/menaquinone biosynthesis C-methylase UbiE
MATIDAYLVPGVASELERLRIQAEAWEPDVEIWLDLIGVQPGWRCVDLGCGPVGILGPLSRRVERTGRVVGVDVDPGQLEAARQYVHENRLESVDVVESSAFNTALECGTFDLTHARFMFAPLGHDEDLLREMLALTRPGGVIAIQEPDISSWNSYPIRPAFRRLVSAIQDAFAEGGGDFNAGRRSYNLLRKAGLVDVQVRAAAVACGVGHPFRRLVLQMVHWLRKRILEGDILTQPELDEAISEVQQIVDDPDTLVISYITTQVWGRKPK